MPQAEALDAKLDELGRAVTAVLLIDVSDDEVVRRLGGRRTCVENGHVFHVEFNPPEQEGVCDIDGSELIVRDDDKPEVIRNRLDHTTRRPSRWSTTTTSAACCAGSTATQPPDEVAERDPPHPGDDAPGAGRGRMRRLPRASVYRMIIRKTPEQVDQMAAAGEILVRCLKMLERKGARRRHHRGARHGGGEVHPLAGRRAGLQGLPRFPGLDLRLAELDGRPRNPRPLRAASAATCSRSTSA